MLSPLWQTLDSDQHHALINAAASADAHSPASVARLRTMTHNAELVHLALNLAESRRKAAAKFGDDAPSLWADVQGVEMASGQRVAAHKAARFARVFPRARVLDLCSGIGGDAMALARAGLGVLAVDLDPVRAWMSGKNASCETLAADVRTLELPLVPFHLDPARRTTDGSRRLHAYADLVPGPAIIAGLLQRMPHAGIKLGPGVDVAELPPGQVEFISDRGVLTQAVLWSGDLADEPDARTATLLMSQGVTTITARPDVDPPPTAPAAQYIHEVDPSVERAGLLGTLCRSLGAPMLHPSLGLLTTRVLVTHPMLTPFLLEAQLPWNPRRVREELARLSAGIVEVKTRGKAVDPDQLQRELRGKGDAPLVLFVLRFDRQLRALIARRVQAGAGG